MILHMCEITQIIQRNPTAEQQAAPSDPANEVLTLACAGAGSPGRLPTDNTPTGGEEPARMYRRLHIYRKGGPVH